MATPELRCGRQILALYHRNSFNQIRLSFRGQNGTFVLFLTVIALRLGARVMVGQVFTGHSLRGGALLELLVLAAGAKDVAGDFLDRILIILGCEIPGYDLRRQGGLDVFGHYLAGGPEIEGRYRFRLWRWCCQMLWECGRLLRL